MQETAGQLHSWFSLSATTAPGRREDGRSGSCSVEVGGVEGTLGFPSPLASSSLSSSCHQSPHERSDASQQRATSDDAQHGSTGSVCQERRRMSRLNFTSCSCHVGEEEERGGGGEAEAASGAIIHGTAPA